MTVCHHAGVSTGGSARYPDDAAAVAARVAVTGRLLLAGLGLGAAGGVGVGAVLGVLDGTSDGYWSLLLVLGALLGTVVGVVAAAVTAFAVGRRTSPVSGRLPLWAGAVAGTAAGWLVLARLDVPRAVPLAGVVAVLSLAGTAVGLRRSRRSP